MSGHLEPSIPLWKGIARNPAHGTAGHDRVVEGAGAYTLKIRSGCEGGGKGPLVRTEKSATLSTLQDQTLFVFRKATKPHSKEEAPRYAADEIASTLNTFDIGESRCNELVAFPKKRTTPKKMQLALLVLQTTKSTDNAGRYAPVWRCLLGPVCSPLDRPPPHTHRVRTPARVPRWVDGHRRMVRQQGQATQARRQPAIQGARQQHSTAAVVVDHLQDGRIPTGARNAWQPIRRHRRFSACVGDTARKGHGGVGQRKRGVPHCGDKRRFGE